MAVSISVSPVAPCATVARPTLLSFLTVAAAGMTQHWRQQTRSTIQLVRSTRARAKAAAARREAALRHQQRDKLPPASAARSAAYFQARAFENEAMAFDALADGNIETARHYQAEATYFAAEARQRAAFAAIWPEI